MIGYFSFSGTGPIEGFVVHQDQHRILGHPDITFNDQWLVFTLEFKGFDGILRISFFRTASMGTNQREASFLVSQETMQIIDSIQNNLWFRIPPKPTSRTCGSAR